MFDWSGQELVHHRWKGGDFHESFLLHVVFGEDLQHVPVQLHGLGTLRGLDCSLDELLVVINTSMVNDGMSIQRCSLCSNVFSAKLQPFIKGDDTSRLQIHGIKHLLSGSILL